MVIHVDDPGLRPLLQLRLGHTEVLEGLPVGELQHAGRVQESRLPGQNVEKATHATIGRGSSRPHTIRANTNEPGRLNSP